MEDKKQIVVFGGSFNPPLNSHFSLAEQIINEYARVEKVIFVPVNSKYQKAELLSNEHRYEMLKLVCDKNEKLEVSDVEITKERPLYTIETLKILQEQYGEYEVCFAIGSDNLKGLARWKEAEKLVNDFKILILERNEDKMEEIIEEDTFLKLHKEAFLKVSNGIRNYLSSTFVRQKIREGKSIRYLTPDEVCKYIEENKLFRGE